eukprot:SAG11_NODE_2066_length_3868_cov_10.653224_4_plen_278_part_00
MADYIPPTDTTPVLDDDVEAAPPGEDDGHTHNDVAVSMHGYDSGADDEEDDASAGEGDTPVEDAHQQGAGTNTEALGEFWRRAGFDGSRAEIIHRDEYTGTSGYWFEADEFHPTREGKKSASAMLYGGLRNFCATASKAAAAPSNVMGSPKRAPGPRTQDAALSSRFSGGHHQPANITGRLRCQYCGLRASARSKCVTCEPGHPVLHYPRQSGPRWPCFRLYRDEEAREHCYADCLAHNRVYTPHPEVQAVFDQNLAAKTATENKEQSKKRKRRHSR